MADLINHKLSHQLQNETWVFSLRIIHAYVPVSTYFVSPRYLS